jgi:hypothetical protein
MKLTRVVQKFAWKGWLPPLAALMVFNLVTGGLSTTRQVLASGSASAGLASFPTGGGGQTIPAAPNVITPTVYLPIVLKNWPIPNVFGVTVAPMSPGVGLNRVLSTTTEWTRGPFVRWQQVESSPGTRNWAAEATLESELLTAAQNNLSVILGVGQTPTWARKVPGSACGPVAANHMAEFAAFMRDMVTRYSAPPYNVKYFELWNEPDLDYKVVVGDSPFGCWGDDADPYYGGGYYGQMLAQVVPQMRSVRPGIRVMVGGLLLDCDPVHPPSGKTCQSSKFLEGILRSGGGPFFDGISFHAYDYYGGALGHYGNANWHSTWNSGGPVSRAKLRFIKSVLAAYGITGKFFANTEEALLCDSNCGTVFEQTKADYIAEAYPLAIADGLTANVWYSLSGWRNSGLLDSGNQPLPAYFAYKFSSQELHDAYYKRNVTEFPGLSGAEFDHGGGRVWVLWSSDGGSHLASLPSMPAAIYMVNGTPISPTMSLTVGIEPRYVAWNH